MLLRSTYFALRRMLRGYIGYVLLILLPLAIITVNGMAFGNEVIDERGRTGMDVIAVGIVLCFQLAGGFYTMEIIRDDLISSKRWRLYSLPYPVHVHVFSILISSTLFSALNGFIMVMFTHWVYGVSWGNIGWVVLVLLTISLFTQFVFMVAVLGIRQYKFAELIGYAYVFSFIILAGYFFFPIPDTAVFNFINTYVNPVALGETAIVSMMQGEKMDQVWLSIGLLLAKSIVLGVIGTLLGRRRLA